MKLKGSKLNRQPKQQTKHSLALRSVDRKVFFAPWSNSVYLELSSGSISATSWTQRHGGVARFGAILPETFTSSCNYQLHLATRSRTGCQASQCFLHCITNWNKQLIAIDVGRRSPGHGDRKATISMISCVRGLQIYNTGLEDNDYFYGHKRSLARTT